MIEFNSKSEAKSRSNNVKVVVRLRPVLHSDDPGLVRVVDNNILIFDPCTPVSSPTQSPLQNRRNLNVLKRRRKDAQFIFDQIFDIESNQKEIYEATTKLLIDEVISGYNCCAFAYGATGSGKTHTMLGSPSDPGVIYLTMQDLYSKISSLPSNNDVELAISYLEIYNEQIKDLLTPDRSKSLSVQQDARRGVIVSGLSMHCPSNARELIDMLANGNANRSQHATDANQQSSRSHAIFQVTVKQKKTTNCITSDVCVGKFNLIDLAGSERATATSKMGQRFREGANINKSLLALGNCINALADGRRSPTFRDSKLTRLLKDSLGGNCLTVMIAAINPAATSYDDTHNALKYAARARNIKCQRSKNSFAVPVHLLEYPKIIGDLKAEVDLLKSQLTSSRLGRHPPVSPSVTSHLVTKEELLSLVGRIRATLVSAYDDRLRTRQSFNELESAERYLNFKSWKLEKDLWKRDNFPVPDKAKQCQAVEKLVKAIEAVRQQKESKQIKKIEIKQSLEKNISWMNDLNVDVNAALKDKHPLVRDLSQQLNITRDMEIEIKDLRRDSRHLKKQNSLWEAECLSMDKLVNILLDLVKEQFYILKGTGNATDDLVRKFEAVQRLFHADKGVAWLDQSVVRTADTTLEGGLSVMMSYPETPPESRQIKYPNSLLKYHHQTTYSPARIQTTVSGRTQSGKKLLNPERSTFSAQSFKPLRYSKHVNERIPEVSARKPSLSRQSKPSRIQKPIRPIRLRSTGFPKATPKRFSSSKPEKALPKRVVGPNHRLNVTYSEDSPPPQPANVSVSDDAVFERNAGECSVINAKHVVRADPIQRKLNCTFNAEPGTGQLGDFDDVSSNIDRNNTFTFKTPDPPGDGMEMKCCSTDDRLLGLRLHCGESSVASDGSPCLRLDPSLSCSGSAPRRTPGRHLPDQQKTTSLDRPSSSVYVVDSRESLNSTYSRDRNCKDQIVADRNDAEPIHKKSPLNTTYNADDLSVCVESGGCVLGMQENPARKLTYRKDGVAIGDHESDDAAIDNHTNQPGVCSWTDDETEKPVNDTETAVDGAANPVNDTETTVDEAAKTDDASTTVDDAAKTVDDADDWVDTDEDNCEDVSQIGNVSVPHFFNNTYLHGRSNSAHAERTRGMLSQSYFDADKFVTPRPFVRNKLLTPSGGRGFFAQPHACLLGKYESTPYVARGANLSLASDKENVSPYLQRIFANSKHPL